VIVPQAGSQRIDIRRSTSRSANSEGLIMDGYEDFAVVMNAEEQYSVWPTELELPPGWRAVGTSGSKQACLNYIEETWTDIRPLSLRATLTD
jgi:MbtH protein